MHPQYESFQAMACHLKTSGLLGPDRVFWAITWHEEPELRTGRRVPLVSLAPNPECTSSQVNEAFESASAWKWSDSAAPVKLVLEAARKPEIL